MPGPARRELFSSRFLCLAEEMGAQLERTALSTIARFFKRRLDMTNYHGERELDEKRAVAKAATSLVGGDAQEAEIFVQQPDAHMRRARYQRLHETPVDTHEILPRTTWNGPQKCTLVAHRMRKRQRHPQATATNTAHRHATTLMLEHVEVMPSPGVRKR